MARLAHSLSPSALSERYSRAKKTAAYPDVLAPERPKQVAQSCMIRARRDSGFGRAGLLAARACPLTSGGEHGEDDSGGIDGRRARVARLRRGNTARRRTVGRRWFK